MTQQSAKGVRVAEWFTSAPGENIPMKVPVLSPADWSAKMDELRRPWHKNYLAMYSSYWGGIVTDPLLMTVPADDHLVHRSDGVFDVLKCINGQAYSLQAHLQRLQRSAAGIDLAMPAEFDRIDDIVRATVQAGGLRDVIIRLMVSRGPGGFSTNPYESPASQLYVIVYKLKTPPEQQYREGVPIISSNVPAKSSFFANIKACNYLLNVLVKKEAVEAGVEYGVSWDEDDCLTEGSTENIILVSQNGELLIPDFDRVLRGVTVLRVTELAETLVGEGLLTAVRTTRVSRDMAAVCREAMLCGTSLDVLPVSTWDGRPVSDGRPGPVTKRLLDMIRQDIAANPDRLTPMFD